MRPGGFDAALDQLTAPVLDVKIDLVAQLGVEAIAAGCGADAGK